DHPLSKGDLFCLHYMMDIENHVPLYLSHLLVTRACMDPILTAFLACWNYEELWHGENLGRLLNEYGIEFDTQQRIAQIRGNLGGQKVDRFMLDHVWVPVGKGVKTQEEVDALALYLFDDEQGEEELLGIDEKIGKLPGLAGVKLMSKALYEARERVRRNPRWG